MKSPSKSFQTFFSVLTFVFISIVATFARSTDAQVYQRLPNGMRSPANIYSPRSPILPQNFRQSEPNPDPNRIQPGQIINGERVVAAQPYPGPTIGPRQNQMQPLMQPPIRTPAQAPLTLYQNTQRSQEPSAPTSSAVRTDKIPPTVFPIPSENPDDSEESFLETQETTESSNAGEKTGEIPIAAAQITPNEAPVITPPIDEDLMAEIRGIRAQLGGGISKSFEGMDEIDLDPLPEGIEIAPATGTGEPAPTDGGMSPEAMFDEELRSVISEQDQEPLPTLNTPTPVTPIESQYDYGSTPITSDKIETLRACARELETLASRLEGVQAYNTADQLRQHATSLWSQARQAK